MKKQYKILLYIVVLIVFIGANKLVYDYLQQDYAGDNLVSEETTASDDTAEDTATESELSPAVDITVTDSEGAEVNLSDFYGKPIVLNFWASWCPNCTGEMPGFQTVYDEYQDEVVFFMVNVTDGSKETLSSAQEYLADNDYTMPFYFDESLSAFSAYGVSGIPITFIIDADGNLAAYGQGTISAEILANFLDTLLD